jgi:subtilisin family serine protease
MLKKTLISSCLVLSLTSVVAESSNDFVSKPFAYENKVNRVILKDAVNATDNYFIQLRSLPAAFMSGSAKTEKGKLDFTSTIVQKRVSTLAAKQKSFLTSVKAVTGKVPKVRFSYTKAFNGLSLELTEVQAEKLLEMPEVLKVIRQIPYKMQTDVGPKHIGADKVWSQNLGYGMKGEGITLGIIDSGINADHPSFAAKGGDDYMHANPNGSGNYFGDCVTYADLCNDKLIGIYSYEAVTASFDDVRPHTGIDYNGHGSHVASTAGGNVLRDLPYYKAGTGEVSQGEPIQGSNISEMSGVAPHANIVSFQVCGATGGCSMDAMLKAIEDGIEAGVDVFNMSIGPDGEGPHPWEDALDMAFLAANEAGIFVALSAGNSGSGASTVGHMAPWTTIVANATHGRYFDKSVNAASNATTTFPEIKGSGGIDSSVTGEVVYAGQNSWFSWIRQCNISEGDLGRLPDLTGKIVLCDRGNISLYEKAANVKALGGIGIIIRNYPGSGTPLYSVAYPIPGIQINETDGNDLLTWIENEAIAEVTISAGSAEVDFNQANVLNATSSRGPNSRYPDLLVPHIAAPGTEIYAAYTDEQPFHADPAPSDYTFLTGTSMASPHIAGAAALIKQVNPTWTPAQIQSAMMLTANSTMYKEDGTTRSDMWDRGAGMIQVDKAVSSPFIMDVSYDAFYSSDPAKGQDATTLNTAYAVNANCTGTCTFTRTFTATQDGEWDFYKVFDRNWNVSLSFEPASLDVVKGESYTVEITAEISRYAPDEWQETAVEIVPNGNSGQSSVYLPVRVKPLVAIVPQKISQDYYWNESGFDIDSFMFRRPAMISFTNGPLTKGISHYLVAGQDSDLSTPFDDIEDGVAFFTFENDGGSQNIQFIISEANNADTDLFIGLDSNFDGIPQEVERLCASASVNNVGESCTIDGTIPGNYWVMVWNFEGNTTEGEKDSITVDVVKSTQDNLMSFNAIRSNGVPEYLSVPVSVLWSGELEDNANYYGTINVFEEDEATGLLSSWGSSSLSIYQKGEAVSLNMSANEVTTGEPTELVVNFAPNTLAEDIIFTAELTLDSSFSVLGDVEGITVSGNNIMAEVAVLANTEQVTKLVIPVVMTTATSGDLSHDYYISSSKNDKTWQGELTQVNLNTPPSLTVSKDIKHSANEGQSVKLSAKAVDAEGDELSFEWRQVSGVSAFLSTKSGANLNVTMPHVEASNTLIFEVTATDGELTATKRVSVRVEKKSSGGAAFGLLVLLLPLLRRKMR